MTPSCAGSKERLKYLRELDERRVAILDSISQQGKLDAALKHAIDAADSKARLEDLYLPYRPKRRTKAQIAREAGLEPLADALLATPQQGPEQLARRYVQPNTSNEIAAATCGARTPSSSAMRRSIGFMDSQLSI